MDPDMQCNGAIAVGQVLPPAPGSRQGQRRGSSYGVPRMLWTHLRTA